MYIQLSQYEQNTIMKRQKDKNELFTDWLRCGSIYSTWIFNVHTILLKGVYNIYLYCILNFRRFEIAQSVICYAKKMRTIKKIECEFLFPKRLLKVETSIGECKISASEFNGIECQKNKVNLWSACKGAIKTTEV